jgi:hypothetical protein
MSVEPTPATAAPPLPGAALDALLALARRARRAADSAELGFLAVNESRMLASYRQAALWFADEGVVSLSGVLQPEANAPYVLWLSQLCRRLAREHAATRAIDAGDVPRELAADWIEWLPAHLLWLPLARTGEQAGALLLVRDTPWQEFDIALLDEWRDIFQHAWQGRTRPGGWARLWRGVRGHWKRAPSRPWCQQWRILWLAIIVGLLALPVRLSVLAPGELVPADPAVIRAPLDGVVGVFMVKPNELVSAGQALFTFDEASLLSKRDVARQALATAEAEYRQSAQMAMSDSKSKAQLAVLTGKIEERRADADYLQGQLQRSRVVAPQDGMALFDDPGEWVGKPVTTGERIMRIAAPQDVEVEAWLAVGDAIPLPDNAPVTLYLNASPLSPVAAHVRYTAHDAVQRPDGSYAYRVRATLDQPTSHRVGLKGTAKLAGDKVPLVYWILRRPLAVVRQMIGH